MAVAGGRGDPVDLLTPYVPRLVIDWLEHQPDTTHRAIDGTGVFADISGFTNLTEKLARRGKAGAEEMGDVLNAMFEELLGAAYQYGAGLIKWGGDAVLLLFEEPRHAEMGCRAAFEMQRVIRRIGRIETSSGPVRLRMSIGIHSGPLDFLLVGHRFKELIVTGPGATTIAGMEKVAEAGDIVVSDATARILAATGHSYVGDARGGGWLLRAAPDVPRSPNLTPLRATVDLAQAFCEPLREHLLGGTVDAEHRNVTVSFIEFQGADALLARDGPVALTAAVAEFVNNCQDAAADHDVTFLSSDLVEDGAKVILIAGAPKSTGDNEARVLTATRQVIDCRGTLPVKAGINCGRVFAGDYGPSYRRVYSITGDIVNLAARLMAKAAYGETVVTPLVLERSRTGFDVETLEPFAVKGKSHLIEAVLLGPIREAGHVTASSLPLVGRESELHTLVRAAASAAAGHGQVVELIGPPGIGKSRLLGEVVALTESNVLWANGDIYGSSTPYQPLQRLFREQLGLAENATMDEVSSALQDLVTSAAPHLLPWLPLIGVVAGVDMPMTEEVRVMDTEGRKERLEWATSEALGCVLTSATTLIFNDLHFMDEATVHLVTQLAADAAGRPWLLITTRRPDTEGTITAQPHVTSVALEPLTDDAVAQLLTAATSLAPLSAHRMETLGQRAGGNPLFLLELAAGAHEFGSLEELPNSIEGVISARIDRLDPEQRRALRAASVLGMTVDLALLHSILSMEKGSVSPFDRWEDLAEFVVPTGDTQLQFVHHLVRETAYEGLAFRRRAVLHARTADFIEQRAGNRADEQAALLSQHCFFGERFHAAWEYSRVAADKAKSMYANTDAAELYRRALAAASHLTNINDDDFVGICESLGTVYDDLGEFASAEAVLAQARRKVGSDHLRTAQLDLKTAIIRQRMGKYSVALRGLSRGLGGIADLTGPEAARVRATLMTRYAWIRIFQGRSRDATIWATRGMGEALSCDDRPTLAHCLEILEWGGIGIGDIPEESPAAMALEIYLSLGDVGGQASIHHTLGEREYRRGNWEDAVRQFSAAEAAYRISGSLWGTVMPMASRAEILSDQGHLREASVLAEEALRIARAAEMGNDIAFVRVILGRTAVRASRFDEATGYFDAARQFYEESQVASLLVQLDGYIAESHLGQGRPAEALALVEDALSRSRHLEGMAMIVPILERIRGVALLEMGDGDAGRNHLSKCLEKARHKKTKAEAAFVLRELLSSGGGPERDRAQWQLEFDELRVPLGLVDPVASPG